METIIILGLVILLFVFLATVSRIGCKVYAWIVSMYVFMLPQDLQEKYYTKEVLKFVEEPENYSLEYMYSLLKSAEFWRDEMFEIPLRIDYDSEEEYQNALYEQKTKLSFWKNAYQKIQSEIY